MQPLLLLIFKFFSFSQTEILHPVNTIPQFLLLLAPGNHCSTFFFLKIFFPLMWVLFESLPWICYDTASVLCLDFMVARQVGS